MKQTQDSPAVQVTFDEFTPPTYEKWKQSVIKILKGADFDKKMFTKTYEDITLQPIYRLCDLEKLSHCKTYPAQSSQLRGCLAGGYLAKLWTIAQETDGKTPPEANKIQKHELAKGATAIAFTLDTATRRGLDADNAPADLVADHGVSLSTLKDLETIFQDLDLGKHELALFTGASNLAFLSSLIVLASKRHTPLKALHGAVAADPIGELITDGSLPRHLDEYLDEMAHAMAWAKQNAPKLRTVIIDTDVYHEGGASAVQEAAYGMSEAVAYVKALQKRGLDIDTIARHIRFHFSIGANFFMEIAKLRSVKTLWAQIMEAFGAKPQSRSINLFVSTSSFTQTVFDPYVNLLRAATQSFSAVIGSIDGLNVKPFDHSIRPSDDFSRRIARNIQIMMQNEFNFTNIIDPVGGSWYVENLCAEFSQKAWQKFQEIEKNGGFLTCIQNGQVQAAVNTVLQSRFKNLDLRRDRAIGNNMYPNMTEKLLEVPPVNLEVILAERRAALAIARNIRKAEEVQNAITAIVESDGSEAGAIIEKTSQALLAGATMGEIYAALNEGASPFTVTSIQPHRWTEKYEALRKCTEAFKRDTGKNVTIFLANMGPIPQHKARADFVTSFMQVAEFDVELNNGFPTVEAAVTAAASSKRDIAIVCSTDATYPELAPAVCRGIKAVRPAMKVMLAGEPSPELRALCEEAVFDDYISVRSNCYETLHRLQKEKGMF